MMDRYLTHMNTDDEPGVKWNTIHKQHISIYLPLVNQYELSRTID